MFLLTHGLVRGGWGGRAPLRVEQALKERGVRDHVGGDHLGVRIRTCITCIRTDNGGADADDANGNDGADGQCANEKGGGGGQWQYNVEQDVCGGGEARGGFADSGGLGGLPVRLFAQQRAKRRLQHQVSYIIINLLTVRVVLVQEGSEVKLD